MPLSELEQKRAIAWLNGEIDPPWPLDEVPQEALLAGLGHMVGEANMFDRRTIFLDITKTRLTRTADHLTTVLDSLVRSPDGWGPPAAVEAQYQLVCEILRVLRGPVPPREGTNRAWSQILHEAGYRGNVPLFDQVEGYVEHQRLLPKLRAAYFSLPKDTP